MATEEATLFQFIEIKINLVLKSILLDLTNKHL